MRQVLGLLLLAGALLGCGVALAADMTGRYATAGTATVAQTVLDLTQQGTELTGKLSGGDVGTLTGTTTGETSFTGTIVLAAGTANIVSNWTATDGIRMAVSGNLGTIDLHFAPVAAQVPETGKPQIYYLEGSERRGPMQVEELKSLITMGVVKPETLVWQNGMADWARADSVAALADAFSRGTGTTTTTAEIQYYVYEDNKQIGPLTLDELLARTSSGETLPEEQVWKTGGDWTRADALAELANTFGQAGVEYSLSEAGQQLGPFTRAEVVKRIATLETRGEDKVWRTGLTQWTLIRDLPELQAALAAAPLPPTAPVTAQTITAVPTNAPMTLEQTRKLRMILGAILGIMYHEFGHALIGEMKIPAVGPEEDTVDEYSALLLSEAIKPGRTLDGYREAWVGIVKYAALLWKHVGTAQARDNWETPWYDEHSENPNRFGNMVCMIFGSNPTDYATLAGQVELPLAKRDLCQREAPKRLKAWLAITAPFRRKTDDYADSPGQVDAHAVGGTVTVDFEPSVTATGQALEPLLKGFFTDLAADVESDFLWPRDFRLVFADCGEVNAFYDPDGIRVIMCWEGIEYFAGAILDGEGVARH